MQAIICIICVTLFLLHYITRSLGVKHYENKVTHVKTGYKLWLPGNISKFKKKC